MTYKEYLQLAEDYAKEQGADCLTSRPGRPSKYGEHIYCFCGCHVEAAYLAGFAAAQALLKTPEDKP